jgi:uncharacterized protein YfaA (DUF2138 family)
MCSITVFFVSLISVFFALVMISENQKTDYLNYHARVNFWNRELSHATRKRAASIINWLAPDPALSSSEYLMAVEMAKGNHCSLFTLDQEESRKGFCQCLRLFPSIRDVYNRDFLKKTKMSLDRVCPKKL